MQHYHLLVINVWGRSANYTSSESKQKKEKKRANLFGSLRIEKSFSTLLIVFEEFVDFLGIQNTTTKMILNVFIYVKTFLDVTSPLLYII